MVAWLGESRRRPNLTPGQPEAQRGEHLRFARVQTSVCRSLADTPVGRPLRSRQSESPHSRSFRERSTASPRRHAATCVVAGSHRAEAIRARYGFGGGCDAGPRPGEGVVNAFPDASWIVNLCRLGSPLML